MQPGYVSQKGGESVLIMNQTLWKNNLNFVKKYTHDLHKFHYNGNYSSREKRYQCSIRAPFPTSPTPVSLLSVLQVFGYPYSVFIPFPRVSASPPLPIQL